jgi:hypothetical protein
MRAYYLIFLNLIIFQSCDFSSCKESVEMYRKEEFEMKIEKISNNGTPYVKIDGKNREGIHSTWKDFGNWLLSIRELEVGDSIAKPKGKAFIVLKKPNEVSPLIFYYECGGEKYK